MITLQLLFAEIQQAKNEDELQSDLAPKIGDYFAAKRSAFFFFDRLLKDPRFPKIINIALSIEKNPVARYIAERHTPVHEAMVTSPKAWSIICPRRDHWHVMAGPIVNRGKLIGIVGCTREKSMPSFDTQNLADLSAICLHSSVWAATITQQQPIQANLTTRELQIAELVAVGKTNAEIGHNLWITENSVKQALKRIFRKLEVSSRAEMVTRLFTTKHSTRGKN